MNEKTMKINEKALKINGKALKNRKIIEKNIENQ